jgi:hypothetical protein
LPKFGSRRRSVDSGTLRPLHPRRIPRTHWMVRTGLRATLDQTEERKTSCPHQEPHSYLLAVLTHCLVNYSQTPIQRHPHWASMKVCEQKFPIIQYFDLPPPLIHRHKLRWTNTGATSGFVHAASMPIKFCRSRSHQRFSKPDSDNPDNSVVQQARFRQSRQLGGSASPIQTIQTTRWFSKPDSDNPDN